MGSGNFATGLPLMSSIGNGRKLAPLGVTGRWRSNRQVRSCHAAECGKLKMRSIDVDALPTAEELQAMFIEGAQAGIAELYQKSAAARAGEIDWADAILVMRGISHDIKGQGGSFGYPLITAVGNSLSTLLKNERLLSEAGLELLDAHLTALDAIMAKAIKGDGGDLGGSYVERLDRLVTEL